MEATDLANSNGYVDIRSVKRQRMSLPADEVEDFGKPRTAGPATTGPESDLGDEDLLITSSTGPVWNQDLPHSRTQCGKHCFVPTSNASNREHCSKCFCHVCDVEADKCQLWGSGLNSSDHCNAHDGMQIYRGMRSMAALSARLSPAAAADSLPVRPAHPDAASRQGASPSSNCDAQPALQRSGLQREAVCNAEMKPAAATLRQPLSELAQGQRHHQTGGSTLLDLDENQDAAITADAAPFAKLAVQPLDPTRVLPDPGSCDMMVEIGTIELPIKAVAPYSATDLQERLVPTGIASKSNFDDPEEFVSRIAISNILNSKLLEVLPLPFHEHGCERSPMRVRQVTIVSCDGDAKPLTVGVSVHKDATIGELRDALSKHPAAACSPEEELVMGYCAGDQKQWAFARSRLLDDLSSKTSEQQAMKGYVAFRIPCVKPGLSNIPSRVFVYSTRTHKEKHGPKLQVYTAHTLLLDLPEGLWKGGYAAAKKVGDLVATALKPHCKPDPFNRAPSHRFVLQRCFPSSAELNVSAYKRDFRNALESMEEISPCIKNGVLYLVAQWDRSALDWYQTASWSRPKVDDSASKEAMANTEFLIREEEKMSRVRQERAQLPRWLLSDLSGACKAYPPGQSKQTEKSGKLALSPPGAACKLTVLPVEDACEEFATLAIQIFVRNRHGTSGRHFFKSPGVYGYGQCLKNVMQYLMRNDPLAQAMCAEVRAAADKMGPHRPCSVTGLMKWLEAGERPEAPQPPGLTVQLHPYQRQSLRFMLDNERGDGGHRRHFWVPFKTPSGFTFWWSPVFNQACRDVPPSPWGGFLAEEMGCGKTVEILALILSNPAPPQIVSGTLAPDGCIQSRATLVVCAVSLVGQWMEEARSKLNGSLRMYQYHGQGRIRDPQKLATSYDLVVTTYQTLGSDWRMYTKKGGNTDGKFQPLGQIKWHRVVLDESHSVKAGGAQQAMACCALKADRRWCCSGTPISTDISEFLGQFNFLGCPPFSIKNYFMHFVKPSWTGQNDSELAATLLYALNCTAIRHTQQQRLGGETVCRLPEKSDETIAVNFSDAEQRLYMRVHKEVRAEFENHAMRGAHHVARNLLAIMSLLSPLRAICSGGVLHERDVKVPSLDGKENAPAGVNPSLVAPAEECSICLNLDMERPCRTACLHWFCRECITAELTVRDKCPLCRTQIDMEQLVEGVCAPRLCDEQVAGGPKSRTGGNTVVSESKLRVLLIELARMRASDPSAKALIFTQFNSTLEWLMSRLTQEGYGYRTISGSMPLKKRTQAIEAFQRDPPTTVFLLSMRSGAVGINLTAANHVFILEPAMNPALEDQAVGRAFRMGQTRPVTVKKLYIKGSVEERIMELVKNRREGRATGVTGLWDEAAEEHRGRLRQQNVAGSINRDRQNLRLAELQLLFREPVLPITAGVQ